MIPHESNPCTRPLLDPDTTCLKGHLVSKGPYDLPVCGCNNLSYVQNYDFYDSLHRSLVSVQIEILLDESGGFVWNLTSRRRDERKEKGQ